MTARDDNAGPPLRLEWIRAGTLTDNPANWKLHPPRQLAALKQLIEDPEVGWAGILLFNEKTGRLIDGHARKRAVPPETPVPVLIGSWSQAAEKKILLTLDPLASLAEPDAGKFAELLEAVPLDDVLQPVQDLLAALTDIEVPDFTAATADEQGRLDEKNKVTCPECGHAFTPA